MHLPKIIEAYVRARNAFDTKAILACFAETAIVHDENEDIRGKEAVGKWIEDTTKKYRASIEPIKSVDERGEILVTARVSGNFDGSPVDLDHYFVIKDNLIVALSID